MSTYLTRPVFEFPILWENTPGIEDSSELEIVQIGKGQPRYQKLRSFTGHVFTFQIDLPNEETIMEFESFVSTCQGRVNGFWVPDPNSVAEIVAVEDSTHLEVEGNLLSVWGADASTHLAFFKAGQTPQYAAIIGVTDTGNNTERLQLGSAVSVDTTWRACRLIYGRFGSDEFSLVFDADNVAETEIRVVELTMEYAAVETGQQCVYLYEFAWLCDSPVYTRMTGFDAPITSQGADFTPSAIEHDGHRQSLRNGETDLNITCAYETGNPLLRFFPCDTPAPLGVTVYSIPFASPDDRTVLFTGRVTNAKLNGTKIEARCETIITVAGRKFPRFNIQPKCNYFLFDQCCRVARASYTFTARISRLGINNLELTDIRSPGLGGLSPAHLALEYFSFGWVTAGSGDTLQARTITKAVLTNAVPHGDPITYYTATVMLSLNFPLKGMSVNDSLTIYPGCDRSAVMCREKFNNFDNYGGHVMAPSNLSIIAVEQSNTNGNKK